MHSHKEEARKIPRDKDPSGKKEREGENALMAPHPRMEDDYNRMHNQFRSPFEKVNCDATMIFPDISDCRLVEDDAAQVSLAFPSYFCICNFFLRLIFPFLSL